MPYVYFDTHQIMRKYKNKPLRYQYCASYLEAVKFIRDNLNNTYYSEISDDIPAYENPKPATRLIKPQTEPKPRIERQWVPLPSNLRKNKNAT